MPEECKNTDLLDLSTFNILKELFGGKMADAVDSHTISAKENIIRIEKAIEKSDASALVHAAHSLKGASSQFGALALCELALKMEEHGKNNMIEKAKELITELQSSREEVEKLMLKELM